MVLNLLTNSKINSIMATLQKLDFFIFVLISIFFECVTAVPSQDYSNICIDHPPTQTTKTTNGSKWTNEDKTDRRHLHFANKIVRMRIASVLKGEAVDDANEDYSKMCPYATIKYLQGQVEIDLHGYGTNEVDYLCVLAAGNKGALNCSIIHTKGYTIKAVIYPHYEGRITTTTFCFEDGEVGWILWSNHDDLTKEEEDTTMKYIQSIGFDITDKVPMAFTSCAKIFS